MTDYQDKDRTIALAGVVQGARLARDIAQSGVCDARAFEASRETLFDFDPETVESVFGGVGGVLHGLRGLLRQLEKPQQRSLEISRYVVSILHLGDRLRRSSQAMVALHDDLAALDRRRQHFDLGESAAHEQLSQIYQERISVLGPRIMVRGEPLHLQNTDNAARIRVALLAGIRAAVLWRQAGGTKLQLLLRRRAFTMLARDLVDENES
jgi:high frequency lysogenization protein